MKVIVYLIQEGVDDMQLDTTLKVDGDILDIPVGHFSPDSTIRIEIVKEKK